MLGVEPAVLEDRQRDPALLRRIDDLEGGVRVHRERLVDDHRDAGLDHRQRVGGVVSARRGQHDEVETVDGEQRIEVGHHCRPGMVLLGRGAALRVGRRDGSDLESRLADEGGVDLPARHAIARQADPCRHALTLDEGTSSTAPVSARERRLGHQIRGPMS